jgi:hypothetical protein
LRITITDQLLARTAQEGAAIPFAVKVYTDTSEPWALVTPTTLRYRIDDPETGCNILGWTTIPPASTATVTVTGAQGTLNSCVRERRQLIVEADHGLSTNCVATREWYVRPLVGIAA